MEGGEQTSAHALAVHPPVVTLGQPSSTPPPPRRTSLRRSARSPERANSRCSTACRTRSTTNSPTTSPRAVAARNGCGWPCATTTRVAWWGHPDKGAPLLLDILDLDDTLDDSSLVGIGTTLLRTAAARVLDPGVPRPEYGRFVPAHWREDAAQRRIVESRMTVLERTGAHLTVERLRLEWRRGTPVPESDGRLAFRPFHDTEELVALTARALEGTLDVHSRADLTRMSAHETAVKHYEEEFATYTSPHHWWRVATLPDGGEPVGFVIPARNSTPTTRSSPTSAYCPNTGVAAGWTSSSPREPAFSPGNRTYPGSARRPTWRTCRWRRHSRGWDT